MRTAKRIYVVYVRQMGKTHIWAAETSRREADHYFKAAEKCQGVDRIWMEVYGRYRPVARGRRNSGSFVDQSYQQDRSAKEGT